MTFKEKQFDNDEEWRSFRSGVLTATDISVILGLNPWKSVTELIKDKEQPSFFGNSYTWIGQALEPVVVQATNEILGTEFKLFEDPDRSFFVNEDLRLGATPDARDHSRLLECKTTKPHNYLKWRTWPPAYYLAQLYTQLICTDRSEGYLAIMSTNLTQKTDVLNIPIHIHKLLRRDRIDEIFYNELERFWECQDINKQYRVNRKQACLLELQLRFQTSKIYG